MRASILHNIRARYGFRQFDLTNHGLTSHRKRIRRFLNKSPDYASSCDLPSHRNSCPDNGISNHTPQYSWPQPAHSQEDPILLALIMYFPLDSNLKYLLAVCKAILTYEESTCKSIADVSHNLHILDLQSTFRFVSLKEFQISRQMRI